MYRLFKDDLYGNKVPYLVADKPTADRLVTDKRNDITLAVEVPRNVRTLIMM
ncbi:MAG: hypothetical protein IJV24_03200 [Prevotella sp.]|nr:hypothetical protein [Prevotella sp.]